MWCWLPGGTTALTAQGANVSVAGTLGVGGAFTAGSGITVSSGNVNLNRSNSLLSDSRSLCSLGNHPGGWCAFLLINRGRDNYHGHLAGSGDRDSVWRDGTELLRNSTGSLPYFSSAGTMGALGIGGTGQILTVSGTGAPTWSNAGGNVNYWQENLGALSPIKRRRRPSPGGNKHLFCTVCLYQCGRTRDSNSEYLRGINRRTLPE